MSPLGDQTIRNPGNLAYTSPGDARLAEDSATPCLGAFRTSQKRSR
jgi:hypothetical protein